MLDAFASDHAGLSPSQASVIKKFQISPRRNAIHSQLRARAQAGNAFRVALVLSSGFVDVTILGFDRARGIRFGILALASARSLLQLRIDQLQ